MVLNRHYGLAVAKNVIKGEFLTMNILMSSAGVTGNIAVTVGYLVIIVAFFYFAMIRPQKKEQQRVKAMLDSLECGDNVLTRSRSLIHLLHNCELKRRTSKVSASFSINTAIYHFNLLQRIREIIIFTVHRLK